MKNSLATLELNTFLEQIAQYSKNEVIQEFIRKIKPRHKLAQIQENHDNFLGMMSLYRYGHDLPIVELEDNLSTFKKIRKSEAILEADELWRVKQLIEQMASLRKVLRIQIADIELEQQPVFDQFLSEPTLPIKLLEELDKAIEPPFRIKSSASPKLKDIRDEIVELKQSISKRLEHYMRSLPEGIIQGEYVTQRNDRYVIPIRVEAKRSVAGIIHDQSDSGQTVFVEPSPFVSAGNRLLQLSLDERDESIKILRQLTEMAREELPSLKQIDYILKRYDFLRAVAKWGFEYNCTIPQFKGQLNLKSARHPLLERELRVRKEKIEPLNLSFDPNQKRVLAITGSNAGGKTVVLKTVGLLTAIAKCGFPIPADEGSAIVNFKQILADIGDEQSLQHNLSTFSGHLTRIHNFFEQIEKRPMPALVLLDELGSGTDPVEGGALSCAILAHLAKHNVVTIATTHLSSVKNFVTSQTKMLNAAMVFDRSTFQATFQLVVGQPGASHAISLAKKIGFSDGLISSTESFIDVNHLQLEETIAKLEQQQIKISQEKETLTADIEKATKERNALHIELTTLSKDRKKIINDAYAEAANMLENTKREINVLLKSAKRSDKEKSGDHEIREKLQAKQARISRGLTQTQSKPDRPIAKQKLEVGMAVWVEKLQSKAEIVAIAPNKKRVTVSMDGISFEVNCNQLGVTDAPKKKVVHEVKISKPRGYQGSRELNLLGLRSHEAEVCLERFINQAFMTNIDEIRIVHGYGTGALRATVRTYLERVGLTDFRDGSTEDREGGGGVTIVKM